MLDCIPNMDIWDLIIGSPMVDCARYGSGGIKGILHREYGVGNGAIDRTPTPLAGDMGRLIKIQPWILGIIETVDETDEFPLTLDMLMR
jgi:hypothetical protein